MEPGWILWSPGRVCLARRTTGPAMPGVERVPSPLTCTSSVRLHLLVEPTPRLSGTPRPEPARGIFRRPPAGKGEAHEKQENHVQPRWATATYLAPIMRTSHGMEEFG